MPRKNHKNKKYSPELKIAAVQAYLSGEGIQKEIILSLEILLEVSLVEIRSLTLLIAK